MLSYTQHYCIRHNNSVSPSDPICRTLSKLFGEIENTDENILKLLQTINNDEARDSYRKLSALRIRNIENAHVSENPKPAEIVLSPIPSVQPPVNVSRSANEKRVAFLIGNANYHVGKLANPINDTKAMESVLKTLNFIDYRFDDCDLKKFNMTIQNFDEIVKGYNVRLFFYSGHGIQVAGSNYFVPIDAILRYERDVDSDCIKIDKLLSVMEGAGPGTNIIIMDACRTNPFGKGWHRGPVLRGLAPPKETPLGSIIAYSTAPNKVASDGFGSNSPYTAAILKYIAEDNITIENLFKKIRKDVMKESRDEQIPWESTCLVGDFYFK